MISKKIHAAFNEQINHEIYSAYLYLSMAAYFHSLNLDGFANWMRVQAKEEMAHAMKFFDHLRDRDARVELEAIDKPKAEMDVAARRVQGGLRAREVHHRARSTGSTSSPRRKRTTRRRCSSTGS